MWNRLLLFIVPLLLSFASGVNIIHDMPDRDPHVFIKEQSKEYIIHYNHFFEDTLFIPKNCNLVFSGGSLSGPIVFNQTFLSGEVNLRGSTIKGSIKNKVFDASWLCAMDGITDDAKSISEIIRLCGNVFFPRGVYRLVSEYKPEEKISQYFLNAIKCHIGINRSNVTLTGEEGAVFITDEKLGTICAYSMPRQIERSIRDIKIENIKFVVNNDGKSFNQYMHTIKLVGINGMTIKDCIFEGFWGDAICLSHYNDTPETGERTRNQNIKILNNSITGSGHYNDRNGISIVSGKNVLVKGNSIKNTSRIDMPGGVDVEPNNSAYTIENIRIEKNYFEGINGGGGAICIIVPEGGPAHYIYVLNNTVKKSKTGLFIYLKSDNTTDHYYIKNNYFDDQTRPYRFEGEGTSRNWIFVGNVFEKYCKQDIPGDMNIKKLLLKNNKKKE